MSVKSTILLITRTVVGAFLTYLPFHAFGEEVPFGCEDVSAATIEMAGRHPSAEPAFPIPPERIANAVQALDNVVKEIHTRTTVPGLAVAVVHQDEVVYAKGFGVRQIGTDLPVDKYTVFQLASVSKPLGATVIAKLVSEGVVNWSTPIVQYLPEFALADPYVTRHLTFGDLYTHRSGLPAHAGDWLEDIGYGRLDILKRLRFEPLAPFRAHYAYTNFGLTAAAEAASRAAGLSWEELSEQLLYRPLGMNVTSSRYSDYVQTINKAVPHVRVNGRWEAKYTRYTDAQSPAGGASSNVVDMAKWLRLQLANGKFNGHSVINEKAILQLRCPYVMSHSPDTSLSRGSFYGLGMNVSYDSTGRVRLGHSGGFNMGVATAVTLLPSENVGIVVLTNGMPIGVPEAIISSFIEYIEREQIQHDWLQGFGERFAKMLENESILEKQVRPEHPIPSQAHYIGVYRNPYYGTAQVKFDHNTLTLVLGPKDLSFPLIHWNKNTFAYYPTGENALGISAVTFLVHRSKATKMIIEHLDKNRLGTFIRVN